jgi:ubiquinone/menaquinone biosynthesis C-methylase UbiE
MTASTGDTFNNAVAYERYVGRWSRLVAMQFVDWLNIPDGHTWLDVGAGTGILTQVILERTSPRQVVGVDLSEQYLSFARQLITDERVELRVADASQPLLDQGSFDVAVAGLVLNFVPSPEDTVGNMKTAVKQTGTVAAYVWDYNHRMEMIKHFWEVAINIDPSAEQFHSATQYVLCNPTKLQTLFSSVGLRHIEVTAIDVPTIFQNFDDFWLPFLAAQGSVAKYLRSLNTEGLDAVRKQLLQRLPINADGTIHLKARAWAVKGTT